MRAMKYVTAIALALSTVSAPALASDKAVAAAPVKASVQAKKSEGAFHLSPLILVLAFAAIGGAILLATDKSSSP